MRARNPQMALLYRGKPISDASIPAMKNLRSYAILDYLKERKYCSLKELMQRFGVSSATIHRDVAELEARDALRRVRGGVAYPEVAPEASARAGGYQERLGRNQAWKQAVAEKALARVCDGDILFLDSSTTVSCLAEALTRTAFSSLTIVTNSLLIAQNFHRFPAHYVRISLGGSYDVGLNAFLGQATLRELGYLTISKAFVSAVGMDGDAVMTNHEHLAGLLMKALSMAPKKYLLIDHSKLNRGGLFKFAVRRTFDEVLCDQTEMAERAE